MKSPLELVVHVGDTKRGRTLGVAHFAANTITAMAELEDVNVRILGSRTVARQYAAHESQVVATEDLATTRVRDRLLETTDALLQIHHFLPRVVEVPTIAIVHDLHLFDVAWKYRDSPHLHQLLHDNTVGADMVVSEFPRTITELVRRYPELEGSAELIESPTLIDDFDCTPAARTWARSTFDLDDGVPTLLYPSQLQAHKNHWNLIAAVSGLADRGRMVRLVLTGSSFREHLTTSLLHRTSQLGLSEQVRFAGHVTGEQLRGLYAEVDGVISPSLAEGGAYIAQEAIAHHQPVACSNLDAVTAHLARLETSIPLFDPLSLRQIEAAIEQLIDGGDAICAGYGRAREIISSWSWAHVAADIVRLARRIAATPTIAVAGS